MSRGRRLAVPLLLAVAGVIFFHEVTLGGRAYLLRDLFSWFYPWREFTARSLAAGEFPLWNPYSFTGTPFLANMQSGLLYPPNIVFWLLDFPSAMPAFLVLQSILAGWFMYLLARGLGCREVSAVTAAVAWAFNGWMVAHVEFPNKYAAAAWLPLILHGVSLWVRGSVARGLAVGAIATACCITAGYPQTTFTVMIGAGVVWAIFAIPTAGRRLSRLASLPCIAALGMMVAAVQLIPFAEALAMSRLTGASRPLSLSFAPAHFLSLLLPHLFGLPGYTRYWGGDVLQFWLGHFYVGLATLVLALLAVAGLLKRRLDLSPAQQEIPRQWIAACVVLAALAALFCMGSRTPLAPFLIANVPGFGHFKWLTTTSLLIAFPLCLLAAFGMDRLTNAARRIETSGGLPLLLAVPAVLLVPAALCALIAPDAFLAGMQWLMEDVILPEQIQLMTPNFGIVAAGTAVAATVAISLASIGLAGWLRPKLIGRLLFLIPCVLFLDLLAASRGTLYAGDPRLFSEIPPLAQEMANSADPLARVYVTEPTLKQDLWLYGSEREEDFAWANRSLLFNLNMPHRLFSASDGDPMASSRWRNFSRRLEASASNPELHGRFLAIAGVRRVVRGLRGRNDIARVPYTLPRVWVAAAARQVPPGTALDTMLSQGWSPYLEVLIEEPPPAGSIEEIPQGDPPPHTVHNVRHTSNTVTIAVTAGAPGWLVLQEADYPGWKATIDGGPVAVTTGNHLFRTVPIPAGRHEIIFRYRPASFTYGLACSAFGLAGALLAWIMGRRRPTGLSNVIQ